VEARSSHPLFLGLRAEETALLSRGVGGGVGKEGLTPAIAIKKIIADCWEM